MSDNQSCPNYGSSLDYEEGKCNVCCFSLAPATGSAAGPNSHKCTTCGHVWESIDDKTAKDVRKAAQVNRQGPSCGLCMHLEMAYRYAEAQGYETFTDAVTRWLNISKPQNAAGEPRLPDSDARKEIK